MTNWTSSAKSRLEAYFTQIHADLQASGVDVDEVTEDLRRHIEQEAAALNLTVVTEQDVGNILGRIGAPESGRVLTAPPPPARDESKGESAVKRPGFALLFFGFILPLGTILFEFLTGACAAVLFDPLPTFAHVMLTLVVPFITQMKLVAVTGFLRRMSVLPSRLKSPVPTILMFRLPRVGRATDDTKEVSVISQTRVWPLLLFLQIISI